jgi:hypothetical protein
LKYSGNRYSSNSRYSQIKLVHFYSQAGEYKVFLFVKFVNFFFKNFSFFQ